MMVQLPFILPAQHKKLFLDDDRTPYDPSWEVVRNYNEFVKYVEEYGCPDVISFDHDLAFEHYPFGEQNPTTKIPYESYEEKTGYDAAKLLVEKDLFPKIAIVHTWNPIGARNIATLLGRHTYVVILKYGDKRAVDVIDGR